MKLSQKLAAVKGNSVRRLAFGARRSRRHLRPIVGRAELYPAAAGLVRVPPPTRQGFQNLVGIKIEDEDDKEEEEEDE